MSWFSSPSATAPTGPVAKPTSDGGYEAPNRSARAQCWESRDIFYECLDEHDILDAAKDDAEVRKKCPKELKYFEKDCASTWVKYFKEKRVMDYKKEMTIRKIKAEDEAAIAETKAKRSR